MWLRVRRQGMPDVFISYAGRDRAWAEWAAWQLTEAGYSVEIDAWNWGAGDNFMTRMADALQSCERVLALFSPAYFESSRYTTDEWTAALTRDDVGMHRLVPVYVDKTDVPVLLRPLVAPTLVGLTEEQARKALLGAVAGPRRPDDPPGYPGEGDRRSERLAAPRLPGRLPEAWNIPPRNAGFVGRDRAIVKLRERLTSQSTSNVQALCGMGGVGKSQLAAEYAYRFSSDYELAWWVVVGDGGLVGEQLAAAAAEFGLVDRDVDTAIAVRALLRHLRSSDRWLMVFDNAEDPTALGEWLPGGQGHVLITSRNSNWNEIADSTAVDIFVRSESSALVRRRVSELADDDTDRLAAELGDLPLAMSQAAGVLAETGMSVAEYLQLIRDRAATIMDEGRPVSYPYSLAAAVRLSLDRLLAGEPAAGQLLQLCAFFGPSSVPLQLFSDAANSLAEPLCSVLQQPLTPRHLLVPIGRYGLARVDNQGIQMHRVVQAVVRDQLPPDLRERTRAQSHQILVTARPGVADDPKTWPQWASLLPHILAAGPATSESAAIRDLATDLARYMLMRGDPQAAWGFSVQLHAAWTDRIGGEHPQTLTLAMRVAHALHNLGRYQESRSVHEATFAIRLRLLGPDHPDTLRAANGVALNMRTLSQREEARELDEETLARRRAVLGEDHPDTLLSATNLAADLRTLAQVGAARAINERTLASYRGIMGEDHPDTLRSANNLASDLRYLGHYDRARQLDGDTYQRRQRVLGRDHPDTLLSGTNLGEDLRALGEPALALALDRDILPRYRKILGDEHPDTQRSAASLLEDRRLLASTG